jgi:hypothetical protein
VVVVAVVFCQEVPQLQVQAVAQVGSLTQSSAILPLWGMHTVWGAEEMVAAMAVVATEAGMVHQER